MGDWGSGSDSMTPSAGVMLIDLRITVTRTTARAHDIVSARAATLSPRDGYESKQAIHGAVTFCMGFRFRLWEPSEILKPPTAPHPYGLAEARGACSPAFNVNGAEAYNRHISTASNEWLCVNQLPKRAENHLLFHLPVFHPPVLLPLFQPPPNCRHMRTHRNMPHACSSVPVPIAWPPYPAATDTAPPAHRQSAAISGDSARCFPTAALPSHFLQAIPITCHFRPQAQVLVAVL